MNTLVLVAVLVVLALSLAAFVFWRARSPRSRHERMLEKLTAREAGALRQLELSADRNWGGKQTRAFDAVAAKLRGLGYSARQSDGEVVYTERGSGGVEFGRGFERPA